MLCDLAIANGPEARPNIASSVFLVLMSRVLAEELTALLAFSNRWPQELV